MSFGDKRMLSLISDLVANKTITTKEADKGGAIIILDRVFYRKTIQEMLENTVGLYYCDL